MTTSQSQIRPHDKLESYVCITSIILHSIDFLKVDLTEIKQQYNHAGNSFTT